MAKANGTKFSAAKLVTRNMVIKILPGMGKAKSVSKALKVAKIINTAKKAAKEVKVVGKTVKGTGKVHENSNDYVGHL